VVIRTGTRRELLRAERFWGDCDGGAPEARLFSSIRLPCWFLPYPISSCLFRFFPPREHLPVPPAARFRRPCAEGIPFHDETCRLNFAIPNLRNGIFSPEILVSKRRNGHPRFRYAISGRRNGDLRPGISILKVRNGVISSGCAVSRRRNGDPKSYGTISGRRNDVFGS
jgi:hypothetical protein